jgi:hypothetical protein
MVVCFISGFLLVLQVNYYEANRLLDEVKEGRNTPLTLINQALCLTGDLDDIRGDFYGGWHSSSQGQTKVCQAWEVCADVHTPENQGL